MNGTLHQAEVTDETAGQRLDKFLSSSVPDLSRNRIEGLIDQGCVTCDGKTIDDASRKVKQGQHYEITIPETAPSHLIAQDIALDIVFEDDHMLVLNKPAGLTVHPAPGHADGTLVNALLAHCGTSLSGIGGVARPGIVHRIDKETSGLLVVAKNDAAHAALSAQLADRSLKRTYAAIVWGKPDAKGTYEGDIGRSPKDRKKMAIVKTGGRSAVTHFKTIESFSPGTRPDLVSLVECNLETGRTHQIRVHFTHFGHALVGDPVYGQSTQSRLNGGNFRTLNEVAKKALLAFNRQALHARELGLIHPVTHEPMRFSCPLPEDMANLLHALGMS